MLDRVVVRNFQSLRHIDVELAPLTVIVGPSSSGKSALGRALRMVASNARGTSFITHGETTCSVEVVTDQGSVILRKGKEDSYVLVPSDPEAKQQTYLKLAGSVPPEVTDFLGIAPRDAINFAGQFDRPYLLDDTGNEVARTLGDLTNVTMVLEASREARRRSLASGSTLKTRRSDLDDAEGRIEEYRGLKEQREALGRAETAIRAASLLEVQIESLDALVDLLRTSAATVKRLADLPVVPDMNRVRAAQADYDRLASFNRDVALIERLETQASVSVAEPPSAAGARSIADRIEVLDRLVSSLRDASNKIRESDAAIEEAQAQVESLRAERDALAAEAGGDPEHFRTAHTWLESHGAFGSTQAAQREHADTLNALEERAS